MRGRDLEAVLRSALPIFGEGAILEVSGDDVSGSERGGHYIQVVAPRVDPDRLADPRFRIGPARVIHSGQAEVHLDVEGACVRRAPQVLDAADAHLRLLQDLGVSAYISVPLICRERTLGALTFMKLGRGVRFDSTDVEIAADLAGRIAVAIDNARLYQASERRREELEGVNRSKDVFLATLSHELRTPLNAIVGWTDMMKDGALAGEELTRAIETIDRNAQALSGLVGDLLDVSRIVTGTLKIESKSVPVANVIESAVVAARPQCANRDITLELEIEDDTCTILGDPLRLRQVIANLLSNAIKFTPPGGKVTVRLWSEHRRVHVRVSDTGEGIAPEFLPHVFERFRQGHASHEQPERSQVGLGLGLAIVKHLVEEHRGTVSAFSHGRGKGASFDVILPALVPSEIVLEEEEIAPTTAEPDLRGVRILIVEDDPDGNELVCTILERYGASVSSATTAAQALAVLEAQHPQVLVSDIGLPDMDGMELIKAVRGGHQDDALIPAVALTAYASRQDATKAIAAGFDAHVAKPVQPASLGTVVARLMSRSGAASKRFSAA